jgi:hypothetical protein
LLRKIQSEKIGLEVGVVIGVVQLPLRLLAHKTAPYGLFALRRFPLVEEGLAGGCGVAVLLGKLEQFCFRQSVWVRVLLEEGDSSFRIHGSQERTSSHRLLQQVLNKLEAVHVVTLPL